MNDDSPDAAAAATPVAPPQDKRREREWQPGTLPDPDNLEDLIEFVREMAGVRLEMVGGLGVWEASPGLRHQMAVDRIRSTIASHSSARSDCGCHSYASVTTRFPDGSVKEPDISVYCRELEEQDTAVERVPEAVIEIISKRDEKKDKEVGVPFCLSQYVKDVILLDPRSKQVQHHRRDGVRQYDSPVCLVLECGCEITV